MHGSDYQFNALFPGLEADLQRQVDQAARTAADELARNLESQVSNLESQARYQNYYNGYYY